MELVFYTADVFTNTRFCGNQLAVFPRADGLSTETMQAIAREFNLSETVFVFAPSNNNQTRRFRIFTPGGEVPFAGHPTIGAACVLAAIGDIKLTGHSCAFVFEEGVGEIPVTVRVEGSAWFGELAAAQFELRPCNVSVDDIAAIVSLDPADLAVGDYPLQAASCGLPFLFVPVRSLEAMARIRINQAKWEAVIKDEWEKQLFLFTTQTVYADCDFHARMFALDLGFGEDPATGSAAAAFAGYMGHMNRIPCGQFKLSIEQGIEMKRPSKLFVQADKGQGIVSKIRVGGQTVLVSKGFLTV